VTLSYLGARKVSRTSRVGNSLTGTAINEVLSTTQEFYDRRGRLYQVREQADTNGTDTTTTYSYDVGNRLSRVQQATSAGTQNRYFTYDNRGFLTSEQHPEKGADPGGNGKVTYSKYDARGHAGRKIDGPNDLTFTYDRAERLKQVDVTGGNPLKAFNYGTSNAAGVRTNGRLESALRYNYVGAPFNATVLLTETYTYGARQGRVSSRTTQMIFNGTPSESFTQTWAWNALGNLSSVSYPVCQFAACVPVTRSVVPGYTNGFLTSVPGWATLSYHANGMVNQITHTNGVVDTQANDPDGMRRPSLISSAKSSTPPLWSSGLYAYDGSGNVVKTGSGYYLYDRVSRLIEGRIYDGPTGNGTQKWQSYGYDPFGNILSISGTSGRTTPTNAATNRLNGTGTTYDTAGNLTAWNGNTYQYDGFNQMVRMKSGAEDWIYTYTAGDERFWSYRVGGSGSLWALRDVDGRVLREYEAHVNWSTWRDYIYRGTQLLASSHPTEGDRHFHLDHLGTPRLITNAGGVKVAFHVYYPFGEEATAFNQDTEQMKLTGHERDLASLAGAGDDLDYMHARHCSPFTGKFLSVDLAQGRILVPQSWNRYTYVMNNPIRSIDPDGQVSVDTVAGYLNALGSNLIFGAGRDKPYNQDFKEGQRLGDEASKRLGAFMTVTGLAGATDGLIAAGPSGGTSLVIVTAPSLAVAGYGVLVSGTATNQSMSAERTSHGEKRANQAKAGDDHRQVGDANRVIQEGRQFTDSRTGNRISISGDRVVVTNERGEIVTQFRTPRANTQKRIESGRWIPLNE
jgi:RHS repeat-associated protein